MALNLRKFENQAVLSVLAAVAGAFFVLMNAFIVLMRIDWERFAVTYNRKSSFLMVIGGTLVASLGTAVVGMGVGFSSAGQKRNSRSRLSWIGFFISAGVIALALMLGVLFFFARDPITVM